MAYIYLYYPQGMCCVLITTEHYAIYRPNFLLMVTEGCQVSEAPLCWALLAMLEHCYSVFGGGGGGGVHGAN